MKKITLALLLLSSFAILFAQAPQKMNYQSVIRKTDGTLLANTLVGIKTSILMESEIGKPAYVETQTTTTNANGLATIVIGGGVAPIGRFEDIDWGARSHFIKTEIDPDGGSNYTISGTSQLLSVPYALYAGNSKAKGKTSIMISGSISDTLAALQIQDELGPYTENIYVTNTTNLTTLDLSSVKALVNITISDNSNLNVIKLNSLNEVYNNLYIENNAKLTSILIPALKTVYGFDNYISNNISLKSISLPSLIKSKGIYFSHNPVLSSIDLPVLTSVHISEASLVFSDNALPSSQVNLILSRILKIFPSSGKYIAINRQNPSAPPTGQGIIDKAKLQSFGNSVDSDFE